MFLSLQSSARGQSSAQSPSQSRQAAIADLVLANRILTDKAILDAFGHVSVRDPDNKNRFLMSRNLAPALVTAADIVTYDFDGNPIDPPPGATHFLERFIHAEVYRARPDVNAIVHSHSPAVIPFGATGKPLRPIYHMSAFLAVGVPIFEIRDAAKGPTNMLVGNSQLGRALAEKLGDKFVVLMRGHGDVVVAATLPMAVFRAVYTETNATLQSQAMALGSDISFLSAEEGERTMQVLDQIHLRAWDLWKRRAAEH